MPHIRHLYPGGNTSRGFYSYYDQVIRPEAATRIFILKGGPGVGKSTLMRRLGEEIAEHRDVEFLHCSSDNDSLDGIVVPSAGVMMVDGTAPHIVDPVLPGAVDGIVNLGETKPPYTKRPSRSLKQTAASPPSSSGRTGIWLPPPRCAPMPTPSMPSIPTGPP